MRLIAATLTALTVATFAQFTHAQDAPQHSAGMRVLDRFVGTWDVVYTHMPTGGETLTQKSWETRKWSMGGNFIHFVNPQEDNPGVPEFHMLLTYDPASSSYPGVFMSGTFRTLVTGTWDEEARSMTFRATFPDGSALVSTHKFIDSDHAESSAVTKNPQGRVVLEQKWKQSRRKQ